VSEILLCAVLPLLGVVIGWFANHWLSSARDRRTRKHVLDDAKAARKRDFLTFLADWHGEIRTTNPQNYVTLRDAKNQRLRVEAGIIKRDFPETLQAEFNTLVSACSDLTNEELVEGYSNRAPRNIWLDALEPLILFIERN
jgi:hypothetical protein